MLTRLQIQHLHYHKCNIYTSNSKWVLPSSSLPTLFLQQPLKRSLQYKTSQLICSQVNIGVEKAL